jgi:hypothetical protein
MVAILAELSGWVGALAILAGYAAFSLGWIANGPLFQACNLSGSAALLLNAYHHGAWPSVVLNVAWAAISTIALFRVMKAKGPTVSWASLPVAEAKADPSILED